MVHLVHHHDSIGKQAHRFKGAHLGEDSGDGHMLRFRHQWVTA